MIEVKGLKKYFDEIKAVDDISFLIKEGEITGFLGPNGAGKSTTLKMMTGYLKPDFGDILINNKNISEYADMNTDYRLNIGYLPENNPLYPDMNVYDFLYYIAKIKQIKSNEIKDRIIYVAEKCSILDRLPQSISTLSKGYRQRVGLAQTILNDPKILVLDEPTVGLDPNQILEIRTLIKELGQEKTVILSSHILQEVQALCDRIIIINQGKIITDTSKDLLLQSMSRKNIIHLALNKELEGDFFESFDYNIIITNKETVSTDTKVIYKYILELTETDSKENENDYSLQENIYDTLSKRQIKILEFYIEVKNLEEVFYMLTN
ncbi:MAG: ATP-binding cassette domain-containing protein [Candidatus Cloacimonetes bacterium]|jgi:ABC-2 type transport system ATP-binding protein|nr:ATP-binding cassette domain-containing protein [Candidatus Cloacimonadota bacterium]